jgi:hypothetical protein
MNPDATTAYSRRPSMWDAAKTAIRVLFFRATREELESLGFKHFVIGMMFTWVVGMGRHWDNLRAEPLQYLGTGSVVYVFVLAFILWAAARPLSRRPWPYTNCLVFVTLTSPPGILYAFPIERFTDLPTAQNVNSFFLALVAGWRVLLYIFYVRRLAIMSPFRQIVASFLPLLAAICALTLLNLDHVVFDLMRGVTEPSPHDKAYQVLLTITFSSFTLLPICFLVYIFVLTTTSLSTERSLDRVERILAEPSAETLNSDYPGGKRP